MCWLGSIPPTGWEKGPALGVSTWQVCIRVVPAMRVVFIVVDGFVAVAAVVVVVVGGGDCVML